ncbi:MAG: tetratricopeptide repeat protein, partial [Planctomycetes bacterium]|nr:tetratricopeptide repeat protein [Planctomycetota bacterium]
MAARTIGGLLVLHVALFALPGCTPAEGGASDPVAAMNQGVALLEQYNYSEASKVFGKLARAYPAWVAAHVNLGLAALNLQNEHLLVAERELTRALELDSRCVHALVARGMLYQHTNKPVEMLRDFEAAAALDPADPHVLFQKAVGLLEANRLEEARALLEAVVKLQPSFASAHWRLREVYVKSGDTRRMTAAIQEFQRLEQAEAGVKIGIKYSEGGKYSLAIRGTAPPGWKGPVPPWEPRPLA